MDSSIMTRLRNVEIEILDFVVDLCKENGLRYYLIYGTLLGAVRHRGFIPWDDDIDICLLRSDYEKLRSILRVRCKGNKEYYFQESCVDKDFRLPFAKVRKKGTVFLEDQDLDEKKEQGIFIDIFPLDKVPRKHGVQKLFSKLIYIFLSHAENDNCYAYRIAHRLACFFENRSCKYLVSYGSAYPVERDVMEAEWFSNVESLQFEGKEYSAPAGYHQYLSTIYGGNYMELPSEDKRVNHGAKLIEFGNDRVGIDTTIK